MMGNNFINTLCEKQCRAIAIMPFDCSPKAYNADVKSKILLASIWIAFFASGLAKASGERPQELVGIWDYTSLTIPSGATAHFSPDNGH
jgi:hypothetical protein